MLEQETLTEEQWHHLSDEELDGRLIGCLIGSRQWYWATRELHHRTPSRSRRRRRIAARNWFGAVTLAATGIAALVLGWPHLVAWGQRGFHLP